MPILLTDCVDDDAVDRTTIRLDRLGLEGVRVSPVVNTPEGHASAGHRLVNILAAGENSLPPSLVTGPGVCMVNSAQRGNRHEHPNGAPFVSFWAPGPNLVVSTLNPDILAVPSRFGLLPSDLRLYDIPTALRFAGFSAEDAQLVAEDQYRSLWFLTILTKLLLVHDAEVPHDLIPLPQPAEPEGRALIIDNFGNVVTGLTVADLIAMYGEVPAKVCLAGRGITIPLINHLTDVEPGEMAAVIGSSGYLRTGDVLKTERLITVVVNGGSAAAELSVELGDVVISPSEFPA